MNVNITIKMNLSEAEFKKIKKYLISNSEEFHRSDRISTFDLSHLLISTRAALDRMIFFRINNNILSFWCARDSWSLFLQAGKAPSREDRSEHAHSNAEGFSRFAALVYYKKNQQNQHRVISDQEFENLRNVEQGSYEQRCDLIRMTGIFLLLWKWLE